MCGLRHTPEGDPDGAPYYGTACFFNVPLDAFAETRAEEEGDGRGDYGRRQSERLRVCDPLRPLKGSPRQWLTLESTWGQSLAMTYWGTPKSGHTHAS
jgi:hypothetical protein